jgi:hypothetical protein
VGHSLGAVLARRLVITAFGEQHDLTGDRPAPFEPELAQFRNPRAWAGLISRSVLLAGMNRGWSVSSAMDWITAVKWSVLQFLGDTIFRGKPTVFAIRRGAPFLVQTRLQWLALMSVDYGPRPNIVAVQLLGGGDDQVSPDDNVDSLGRPIRCAWRPILFLIRGAVLYPWQRHRNGDEGLSANPKRARKMAEKIYIRADGKSHGAS